MRRPRPQPPELTRRRVALLLIVLRRLAALGRRVEGLPAMSEADLVALVGPHHARYVRRAMAKVERVGRK